MVKWIETCQVSQEVFLLTRWASRFRLGQSLNLVLALCTGVPSPPNDFSSKTQEINTQWI